MVMLILVVEDSHMVTKVIRHVLSQSAKLVAHYAASFAEARQLIESSPEPYFAALVDLSLPDAPAGEVVDYTLSLAIPTVVLTSSFDEKKRELMLHKGIVDYVTKEGRYSYERALGTLHRLIANAKTKVLVVDDSSTQRAQLKRLLNLQMFNVIEAEDGVEAIKLVVEQPDIRLLITDYHMPRMDGCELIKNLRVKHEKTDLVIIGLSSESDRALSARFIKQGANDFLQKPFNHEEFFCRINHNLELIELIEAIREANARDELTGIYNRQFFFKKATPYYSQSRSMNSLSVAVINLYRFSSINTEHGNSVGDALIKRVALRLVALMERFLVARSEGDQFYVLLPGMSNDQAVAYIERVRQLVSADTVNVDELALKISFTAGVSNRQGHSLDELIHSAESCLYRAKEAGGDLVFGD